MKSKKPGFTLIELLVVIAIIGILSTLAIIALGSARQKARDSKRVADASQISKALELYYSEANSYPAVLTAGQPLSYGTTTYLDRVPSNPSPRNDGNCPNDDYSYAVSADTSVGYTLHMCLGAATGALPQGSNYITPAGFNGDSSLIGWWKMDEGTGTAIADSSSSGWNATADATNTWQASSSCKFGACSLFNSTSYIRTNNQVTISSPTNSLTVAAWVYLTDSASQHTIMGDGTTGTSSGFIWIYVQTGGTYVRFHYANGINVTDTTATSCFSLNTWSHVAVTADYTNKVIKYYCNGALNTTSAMSGTPLFPSATRYKYIGAYSPPNFNWAGRLDDVRLYNRALSAAEVQALFNAGQ